MRERKKKIKLSIENELSSIKKLVLVMYVIQMFIGECYIMIYLLDCAIILKLTKK